MQKHSFNDGDIIVDEEFREIFVFLDSRDGLRATLNQKSLRLATDEEKKKLKDSGADCTEL